ncbi:MAG: SH3 domain-containing protein [Bdellovibrionales bacterium]|jgi:SH3-like domain-containing protein|nr:SH3 domain-containing protein [Bdellovibrionales bacterium]
MPRLARAVFLGAFVGGFWGVHGMPGMSSISNAQEIVPDTLEVEQAAIAQVKEGVRAEPVCVVSRSARLRARPSTNAPITWNVGRYMPFERLRTENGWSQVRDLRGQTHWVISKNVSPKESCVVVRARTAKLHQGPGYSEPVSEFGVADRYMPFRHVEKKGSWVKIEDDFKGVFWTQASNVWTP